MRKIMREILRDHASNAYYGQWPMEKPLIPGLESPAIAHSERVASARFVAFDVPERDFPENRSPPRWKFVYRPKRKICAPGEAARFQRRPRRSPLLSKATALQALRQLVLPLKERRMQSAVGRSCRSMLCDLRIFGTVSGDHQHDVIHRNGLERPARQQFLKDVFRLALGSRDPVSQGVEHALRPGVERSVVAGNIVRPESLDPGDADWFSLGARILRAMVGMQAVRRRRCKPAVRIMPLAIVCRRNEHADHSIDILIVEARIVRHRVGRAVGKSFRPAAIDTCRFDIVELLRMLMNFLRGDVGKAGNWDGQVGMRIAIVEIRAQAFEERPIAGGELHWFQYLQPGRQVGPCLTKGCHASHYYPP